MSRPWDPSRPRYSAEYFAFSAACGLGLSFWCGPEGGFPPGLSASLVVLGWAGLVIDLGEMLRVRFLWFEREFRAGRRPMPASWSWKTAITLSAGLQGGAGALVGCALWTLLRIVSAPAIGQ